MRSTAPLSRETRSSSASIRRRSSPGVAFTGSRYRARHMPRVHREGACAAAGAGISFLCHKIISKIPRHYHIVIPGRPGVDPDTGGARDQPGRVSAGAPTAAGGKVAHAVPHADGGLPQILPLVGQVPKQREQGKGRTRRPCASFSSQEMGPMGWRDSSSGREQSASAMSAPSDLSARDKSGDPSAEVPAGVESKNRATPRRCAAPDSFSGSYVAPGWMPRTGTDCSRPRRSACATAHRIDSSRCGKGS